MLNFRGVVSALREIQRVGQEKSYVTLGKVTMLVKGRWEQYVGLCKPEKGTGFQLELL